MKTKLLKEVRKRYSITHYPQGLRRWGDTVKGPITILKDIDDIGSQYEKIVEIKTKIYLESIQRVKEKEDRLNSLNKVFIKDYK